MQLFFAGASPFVRKVMVVAHEAGLVSQIETLATALSPVAPNETLRAKNPIGKVPALITDDGAVLYDSRVICEYLDSLHHGRKLFPPGGEARWDALRRQALGDGILDAAVITRYETVLRPPEKQWTEWREGQFFKIRTALDSLEAGPPETEFDIGAITIACALGYLDFRYPAEEWRRTRPGLAAWFAEISARPSLQATKPA
jgi:glutathione S-transferase